MEHNQMTPMQRINLYLTKFEADLLILGISSMGIIMSLQVFSRTLLGNSIVWSEELVRHIFIWTIFIGMSYGIAIGTHVKLEYFVDKFPLNVKKAILILMNIAVIALLIYIFIPSIIYVEDQMHIKAPTMGYPMGFVMLSMPISIVLTVFRLLQDIARIAKMDKQEVAS